MQIITKIENNNTHLNVFDKHVKNPYIYFRNWQTHTYLFSEIPFLLHNGEDKSNAHSHFLMPVVGFIFKGAISELYKNTTLLT